MHAYVFIDEADATVIDALGSLTDAGENGVRFATRLLTSHAALAAISVESSRDLSAALERLQDIGARGLDVAVVAEKAYSLLDLDALSARLGPIDDALVRRSSIAFPPIPILPKTMPPLDVEAFIRVELEVGSVESFLKASVDVRGFLGVAVVMGAFDALLEVGADSLDELQGILLDSVPALPGVRAYHSGLAFLGDRNG
jgi:DNA-binding Lrp family transcriptional regulator